jgi:hypothetical protein
MKKGTRRSSRIRQYYDPGKNPKPRTLPGGEALDASVVKETRQLRRARERKGGK